MSDADTIPKTAHEPVLLDDTDMATFAARGYLRFDALVPDHVNQRFLNDVGASDAHPASIATHYANMMNRSTIPLVNAGTSLARAYPRDSALAELMALPRLRGAIESLVGAHSTFDHHFLHVTFPRQYHPQPERVTSQPTHQDSTIDPRQAFDIQVFYFPHAVTAEMGGTRFIPGTQFRVVSEAAISRYQNIAGQQHAVCPAGTVMIFHMGLWHGGGINLSDELRYMFKIRLCPTQRQANLWRANVPTDPGTQRPIFWTSGKQDENHLHAILTRAEPWFEADTGRLEYINRVCFWRYLTADDNFDADYWVRRIENEYT